MGARRSGREMARKKLWFGDSGGEGAGGSLNGRGSGAIDTGLYCPVQKTI